MRYALIVLLLSGCAQFTPRDINETVLLVQKAGGSGCLYIRGNSRPYADVSILSVSTYGKNSSYKECLGAIPEQARSMLQPEQ